MNKIMTPQEQERRYFIQSRCIRKHAKKKGVNLEEAGFSWCNLGLALQWKEFYDKNNASTVERDRL